MPMAAMARPVMTRSFPGLDKGFMRDKKGVEAVMLSCY